MDAGLLVVIGAVAAVSLLLWKRHQAEDSGGSAAGLTPRDGERPATLFGVPLTPEETARAAGGGQRPEGPELDIRYTDGQGARTERRITVLDIREHEWGEGFALRSWCHGARDGRTFLTDRIDEAWIPETGEVLAAKDLPAWLLIELGRLPASTIPERPPGRISTRRPQPAIGAIVTWERSPGDVETFDIDIDEVEMAGGRPFAFSGRARRRRSDTDRAWSGRRRFKLRGWDTPEAPILAFYEPGAEAPVANPMRWLQERTGR